MKDQGHSPEPVKELDNARGDKPASIPRMHGTRLGEKAFHLVEELGRITDEPPGLTRTFLSPAQNKAKLLVAGWMREAGLEVFEDAAGNLIGRRDCGDANAGTVVCGSHLDTVRNAGKFDGAVGIVAGILAAAEIRGRRLPFHLEIACFSDEEGVRFPTAYLGSHYYIGRPEDFELKEAKGITVREAIAAHVPAFPAPPPRGRLLGYVEAHIEQGAVLESCGLALGVVTAIAGQTRARIVIEGKSGHAGTTPMSMRRDALAGAAECTLLIEERAKAASGLVATVGNLRIDFAAGNVIPGRVEFTVDIRDAGDVVRTIFARELFTEIEARMTRRKLSTRIGISLDAPATPCTPRLTEALAALVEKRQGGCPRMVSGAGHDAVALAEATDTAMLFIRCRDGLSHHPDEFAEPADIGLAVETLAEFFLNFPIP